MVDFSVLRKYVLVSWNDVDGVNSVNDIFYRSVQVIDFSESDSFSNFNI